MPRQLRSEWLPVGDDFPAVGMLGGPTLADVADSGRPDLYDASLNVLVNEGHVDLLECTPGEVGYGFKSLMSAMGLVLDGATRTRGDHYMDSRIALSKAIKEARGIDDPEEAFDRLADAGYKKPEADILLGNVGAMPGEILLGVDCAAQVLYDTLCNHYEEGEQIPASFVTVMAEGLVETYDLKFGADTIVERMQTAGFVEDLGRVETAKDTSMRMYELLM